MTIYLISDEAAMLHLGATLAALCRPGAVIFLQGGLGAGKTTLVRGILNALGYTEAVKSPTYTLVESYQLKTLSVFHFDLYRLKHPQELLDIGLEDYLQPDAVCLIEWPEKALMILPTATISCMIEICPDGASRRVTVEVLGR
jgi:tRNA threonylcarbamoyladenosine biosynthesis protein TsaE